VTHDLHEAFLLAGRVAVLRAGRLEQIAPPSELLQSPGTTYVRELLARARIGVDGQGAPVVRQRIRS
jgi:ABC-type proline/glycine betaine transport system ATPase subunit